MHRKPEVDLLPLDTELKNIEELKESQNCRYNKYSRSEKCSDS